MTKQYVVFIPRANKELKVEADSFMFDTVMLKFFKNKEKVAEFPSYEVSGVVLADVVVINSL
jgi:hypothetical protein